MGSKIKVGTTWNKTFIEEIARLNKHIGEKNHISVGEVYGSMPNDPIGSARSKDRLYSCDYDRLREHVTLCHDNGIQVSYANNALCLGSTTSLDTISQMFYEHIGMLTHAGIDSVILAFPLLIELSKKEFPELKTVVSTIAHVDSVKMAQYYKNMGADTIVLPVDANRNFKLLSALHERFKDSLEFELLMTDACVYECPYRQNHFALQSHDSKERVSRSHQNRVIAQYPFDRCWAQITKNWPAEFLKSRWIRPEDISYYEKRGFSKFKISGRTMPEELIIRSVKAYLSRQYNGNFLEVLPIIPGNYKSEGNSPLAIDNRKLNGFLRYFINNGTNCGVECQTTCNYCDNYATKIRN